jgi:hypothetical protein
MIVFLVSLFSHLLSPARSFVKTQCSNYRRGKNPCTKTAQKSTKPIQNRYKCRINNSKGAFNEKGTSLVTWMASFLLRKCGIKAVGFVQSGSKSEAGFKCIV